MKTLRKYVFNNLSIKIRNCKNSEATNNETFHLKVLFWLPFQRYYKRGNIRYIYVSVVMMDMGATSIAMEVRVLKFFIGLEIL